MRLDQSQQDSYLSLFCDIGELLAALSASSDVTEFLGQIVALVSRHLGGDVCSIYLYDEATDSVTLKATVGLNPELVGRVSLKLGEGLVGHCLETLEPVCEAHAFEHPSFRLIPDLNEEGYGAFLAVPIYRLGDRIGGLVLQRAEANPFVSADVLALRATASQLASALEIARVIDGVNDRQEAADESPPSAPHFVVGKVASPGYAYAEAVVLDGDSGGGRELSVEAHGGYGLEAFQEALKKTEAQLESFQQALRERLTEAASLIFTAHLLMLKDAQFTGDMAHRIEGGEDAVTAVVSVARRYTRMFAENGNVYVQEKASDVEDLARRIIANLTGRYDAPGVQVDHRLVVARELYPSDMLRLSAQDVKGIVLVSGGVTSHLSILARSLQIPLIIAETVSLLNLPSGTPVLLDTDSGRIYLRPSDDVVATFEKRNRAQAAVTEQQPQVATETYTADGVRIHLMANINLLSELKLAKELNLEGVGLYRTEFPFMIRPDFPSEDQQIPIYRHLVREMQDREVTVRTLDIGGDKLLSYYDHPSEENPEMGLRSIRFSLLHPETLQEQIRAILRAGAGCAGLRVMFPMISSLDEFQATRQVVLDCLEVLARRDLAHNADPAVGVMVEIPSLVEIIDDMAEAADFLCIGTNDFVQFMLAADRANEKVASYYLPHHPAVLRALRRIIKAADDHDTPVSVCGEMAHQQEYIPFLLGAGVRTLSLDPRYMPTIQRFIGNLSLAAAERRAKEMLAASTISGTQRLLDAPV